MSSALDFEDAIHHLRLFFEKHEVAVISVCLTGLGFYLFRKWLKGGRCKSEATMNGKTVIITGANAGIGKETARDLVRRGARVIMACRNMDRANAAMKDIQNEFPDGNVVVRCLDLASLDSIRIFAKEILNTETRIDILINNAGLMCPKSQTKNGFDMIFGTNHLGHFLLTNLLLERLKNSAPSRIITLSSDVHKMVSSMNWNDLNYDLPNTYSPMRAYGHSKLANILFTKELARRLLGTGVTTYAVHPGLVDTRFGRYVYDDLSIGYKILFACFAPFAKTVKQGAQTTIYCAVDEHIQNKSGYYYADCRERVPSAAARSDEAAKQLWDLSLKLVGLDNDSQQSFNKT